MTQPDQTPAGQTPSAPDVDQPDGGEGADSGRTPSAPEVDQPDGGADDQATSPA